MQIEKIAIRKEIMCIDTARQTIDMQQIQNRRFLYNPRTGILVLGFQYAPKSPLLSSHADELAGAGITKDYDDFVRGWVGTGRSYPKGVIHFAPSVDERCVSLFDRAFSTLEMFQKNGALADTVIRGFGKQWERPLSDILVMEQKISVREQLQKAPKASATKQKNNHQQER